MNEDLQHLKLLSIFHYVVAGISALFACFPLIHFFIGLAMAAGWFPDTDPGARVAGTFFMVIAAIFIALGFAYAVCLVIAGRSLAAQKNRTLCLVMAGLSCLFMPFGTALGIFTIIVLMRPSVQELFEASA
jgi:hypothetical protein